MAVFPGLIGTLSLSDAATAGGRWRIIQTMALLIALCASTLVAAQSATTVELENFVERRASETRVSGGLLLGVALLGEPDHGFSPPRLVLPSKTPSGPYCVETVGIDGSYWSQGEIPATAVRGGEPGIRILYGKSVKPGDAPASQLLDQLGAANVAVLVTVGACSTVTPTRQIVVADRLNGPRQWRGVRLFLNASKNEVEASYNNGGSEKVNAECFDIKSQRQRLAFDSFCEFRAPLGEKTVITLKTTRFGRALQEVTYTLILGGT